jgi:hypothetical protein
MAVDHVESLVEASLSARLSTPLSPASIDTLPEGPTDKARLTPQLPASHGLHWSVNTAAEEL